MSEKRLLQNDIAITREFQTSRVSRIEHHNFHLRWTICNCEKCKNWCEKVRINLSQAHTRRHENTNVKCKNIEKKIKRQVLYKAERKSINNFAGHLTRRGYRKFSRAFCVHDRRLCCFCFVYFVIRPISNVFSCWFSLFLFSFFNRCPPQRRNQTNKKKIPYFVVVFC